MRSLIEHDEKKGESYLYHSNNNAKIMKTDLEGNIIWTADLSGWAKDPVMKKFTPQGIRPCDAIVVPGTDILSTTADANKLIADHLDRYLRRNGADATYEGWIGVLHPENVSLDSRLMLESSAHKILWKERVTTSQAPSDFWQDFARLTSKRVRGVAEGELAGDAVLARVSLHLSVSV